MPFGPERSAAVQKAAIERCRRGWHDDPDNSGMCVRCSVILDCAEGEDPNRLRKERGLEPFPV